MKTAISFSGGGILGIASLKLIQNKYNNYSYDLYTGTSTGSLISIGYVLGMSTENILDFYLTEGKKIFSPSWGYRIKSMNGLILPKYDDKILESVLKKICGTKKLKDLKVDFMCNSYNLTQDKVKYFKSWQDADKDYFIWEVVKASCSAETYFKSHVINNDKFLDGGNDSNTLCLSAYIELKNKYPDEYYRIIDVGTGDFKNNYNIGTEGMKDWLPNVVSILMNANNESQRYMLKNILREQDEYIYLNRSLPYNIQLDDVSDEAIKELLK